MEVLESDVPRRKPNLSLSSKRARESNASLSQGMSQVSSTTITPPPLLPLPPKIESVEIFTKDEEPKTSTMGSSVVIHQAVMSCEVIGPTAAQNEFLEAPIHLSPIIDVVPLSKESSPSRVMDQHATLHERSSNEVPKSPAPPKRKLKTDSDKENIENDEEKNSSATSKKTKKSPSPAHTPLKDSTAAVSAIAPNPDQTKQQKRGSKTGVKIDVKEEGMADTKQPLIANEDTKDSNTSNISLPTATTLAPQSPTTKQLSADKCATKAINSCGFGEEPSVEGNTANEGGESLASLADIFRPFKSPVILKPVVFDDRYGAPPPPLVNRLTKTLGCRRLRPPRPLHSPSLPDAFVLFVPEVQPSHTDLLKRPKVPIVVDPILATKLRPHQREGVKFMFECLSGMRNPDYFGCILADDMGLGKTLQAITVLWTLLRQGFDGYPTIRKAIIVCPCSLVSNWLKEMYKWGVPIQAVAVDKPTRAECQKCIEDYQNCQNIQVMIISYETFRINAQSLQDCQVGMLICDEGHRLKNAENQTTQCIAALNTKRRLVITGTPLQNNLTEFYSMVNFCNQGILGTSADFHTKYEVPILQARDLNSSEEKKKLAAERLDELFQIMNVFLLRRTAASILTKHLPPKVEQIIFCKVTDLQKDLYNAILSSKSAKRAMQGEKSQALPTILTLRRLCNHPRLIVQEKPDGKDSDVQSAFPKSFHKNPDDPLHSGKMLILAHMLKYIKEQTSDKILLVSNFTETLDYIQTYLQSKKYSFVRLDGSTKVSQRQRLVDKFNDPAGKEFVFLLSSKAGGCGLNLVGACRLVLYDSDWNPANDAQVLARVWRDGQKKDVWIYRLLSTGTLEEKIYQRQVFKEGLQTSIVSEQRKNEEDKEYDMDNLRALFQPLKENTLSETHDKLCCPCGGHAAGRRRVLFKTGWEHYRDIAEAHDPSLPTAAISFLFRRRIEAQDVAVSETKNADEAEGADGSACAGDNPASAVADV